jgi:pSer/pThr/pTyr-binding forkhead associated (FHA) protein
MTELSLKFKDPNGEVKRVEVRGEKFVVGRHSESDLAIPDGRLSREHLEIKRFGDFFVARDLGSSNGTLRNGSKVTDPVALSDDDELDLGGLIIKVELVSDMPGASEAPPQTAATETSGGGPTRPQTSTAAAGRSSSVPTGVLFIAPIFGLLVLVFAGGLVYLLAKKPTDVAAGNEFQYSKNSDDDDEEPTSLSTNKGDPEKPGNSTSGTASPSNNSSANSTGQSSGGDPSPPPANLDETGKTEQNGAAFLRRIAQNDPRAFMTTEQAKRVNGRIKQVAGGSAIADNINSARKNAAQIKALAQSKNLKPQLLAVAAIAKLGTSRGDVLQAAGSMADVLDKLNTQIGSELADDSLLMIAAYDQGAAGDFLRMRNMLQDLATKFPESSRTIRSIWFLEKNGKITGAEFDRALTFLAIGTITQNPKDFGVNAEALTL